VQWKKIENNSMTAKDTRTATELAEMIMREIRKRPECHRIRDVAIVRSGEQTPPNPNWNVAFTVDGNVMAPELAYRVARALQSHFELD
jgi:hypothetical protein